MQSADHAAQNHLFIYKPLIKEANSFTPNSLTPNSFTKADKQQKYSL